MYLFIYSWLCWVFVALRRLFSIAARVGATLVGVQCSWDFSLQWLLLSQSRGSRCADFISCVSQAPEDGQGAVAYRLSCSVACGVFLDERLNP